MSNPLSEMNPTERFTGLGAVYAQHRPDYPAAAIQAIIERAGLGASSTVVDVGCGTGIASRQFAAAGMRVIGVDPNFDMLREARDATLSTHETPPEYRQGRAEATGLRDNCTDLVVSAQAFHWFDPAATLTEFHRLLVLGGWVALMWNERDEADPFTAAYGRVIATTRDGVELERQRQRGGEALLASPLFISGVRFDFPHQQILDQAGVIGRAMSMSFSPKNPAEIERFQADLRTVYEQFQTNGQVALVYQTSVFMAQRKSD